MVYVVQLWEGGGCVYFGGGGWLGKFQRKSVCTVCAVPLSAEAATTFLFLLMTLQKMDAVEVFAAGEKGRGLRTTKEMKPGEVVFAEASFAAVVFDR